MYPVALVLLYPVLALLNPIPNGNHDFHSLWPAIVYPNTGYRAQSIFPVAAVSVKTNRVRSNPNTCGFLVYQYTFLSFSPDSLVFHP